MFTENPSKELFLSIEYGYRRNEQDWMEDQSRSCLKRSYGGVFYAAGIWAGTWRGALAHSTNMRRLYEQEVVLTSRQRRVCDMAVHQASVVDCWRTDDNVVHLWNAGESARPFFNMILVGTGCPGESPEELAQYHVVHIHSKCDGAHRPKCAAGASVRTARR